MRNNTVVNQGHQLTTVTSPTGEKTVTDKMIVSSYSAVSNVGNLIKGDHKTPLPWSYDVYNYRNYFGDMTTRAGGFVTNDLGVFYTAYPIPPDWDRSAVDNRSLNKLGDAIRGGLDLSIDLGEFRQTHRMFAKATKLVGVVRAIPELGPLLRRLGNLLADKRAHNVEREVKALSKTISDIYLEVQFGWKPILKDIHDVAEELVRVVLNKIQDYKVTATLPMADPPLQQFRSLMKVGGLKDRYNIVSVQRCTYGICLEVPGGWDPARWSSLNPVSIAWELMPYSFVVDWLYDVGGALRRFENALIYSKRFKSGYKSELFAYACAYRKEGSFLTEAPNYIKIDGRMSASVRQIRFRRTVLATMPFGHLPTIRANLGSTQLLESAALLAQFLRPERVWRTHQIM